MGKLSDKCIYRVNISIILSYIKLHNKSQHRHIGTSYKIKFLNFTKNVFFFSIFCSAGRRHGLRNGGRDTRRILNGSPCVAEQRWRRYLGHKRSVPRWTLHPARPLRGGRLLRCVGQAGEGNYVRPAYLTQSRLGSYPKSTTHTRTTTVRLAS